MGERSDGREVLRALSVRPELRDRTEVCHPRGVDDRVEPVWELLPRECLLQPHGLREVGHDGPGAGQVGGECSGTLLVAGEQDEVVTTLGKRPGHRGADPGPRSGHEMSRHGHEPIG